MEEFKALNDKDEEINLNEYTGFAKINYTNGDKYEGNIVNSLR